MGRTSSYGKGSGGGFDRDGGDSFGRGKGGGGGFGDRGGFGRRDREEVGEFGDRGGFGRRDREEVVGQDFTRTLDDPKDQERV